MVNEDVNLGEVVESKGVVVTKFCENYLMGPGEME
jgi:hypothetical protein